MRLIDRMLPLDEWEPDDGAEMETMLEKAARPHESWARLRDASGAGSHDARQVGLD
jgi:hypothetical protein